MSRHNAPGNPLRGFFALMIMLGGVVAVGGSVVFNSPALLVAGLGIMAVFTILVRLTR